MNLILKCPSKEGGRRLQLRWSLASGQSAQQGKSLCQTWPSDFLPLNPHGGSRKCISLSCPLISTKAPQHTCKHNEWMWFKINRKNRPNTHKEVSTLLRGHIAMDSPNFTGCRMKRLVGCCDPNAVWEHSPSFHTQETLRYSIMFLCPYVLQSCRNGPIIIPCSKITHKNIKVHFSSIHSS